MVKWKYSAIAVAAFACCGALCATNDALMVVKTTTVAVTADPGIGHDQRERIAKATTFIQEKKYEDAVEQLNYVIQRFEMTHIKSNVPVICASSQEELDRFRKETGRTDAMWLDWAYMKAYYYKAFIASDQKRYDDALALLDKATSLAPYEPGVRCEKGNVYNKMGQPAKGLDEYRKARELAKAGKRYRSQEALAYRGMGYAHIELGDIDLGEAAYMQSLEIEPDSEVAKAELKFIKTLKARRTTSRRKEGGNVRTASATDQAVVVEQPTDQRKPPRTDDDVYQDAKKYAAGTERIWALVNGEVFCNTTTDEAKRAEISALLYRVYTNAIRCDDKGVAVDFTRKPGAGDGTMMPIELCFEACMLGGKAPRSVYTNLTIGNLAILRASLVKVWIEKKYPRPTIIMWQQKIMDDNMFEPYTYWLLRDGRPDEFAEWLKTNGEHYQEFLDWRQSRSIDTIGSGEPWQAPRTAANSGPPQAAPWLTDVQKKWAMATYAILTEVNRGTHDQLGGHPKTPYEAGRQVQALNSWWGVKNRDDLRGMLYWLYREGHRDGFDNLGGIVTQLLPGDLAKFMKKMEREPDRLSQVKVVMKHYRDLGDKGILAWDYDRYAAMCGWGYLCNYLTEEEAWLRIMPAARKLQATFSSWEDLGENYVIGREYWSAQQTRNDGQQFRDVCKRLCDNPSSPWRTIPWDTDLGTNRMDELEAIRSDREYDKRLFEEEEE